MLDSELLRIYSFKGTMLSVCEFTFSFSFSCLACSLCASFCASLFLLASSLSCFACTVNLIEDYCISVLESTTVSPCPLYPRIDRAVVHDVVNSGAATDSATSLKFDDPSSTIRNLILRDIRPLMNPLEAKVMCHNSSQHSLRGFSKPWKKRMANITISTRKSSMQHQDSTLVL